MKKPIVSVVIPTYNGAKRILPSLMALSCQIVAKEVFEVIVIDNASTDNLEKVLSDNVAKDFERQNIKFRVVCEARKGLTYARIRGVREAHGELICFLDDDNIPDLDYLSEGSKALDDRSVGLLVSRVSPEYEVKEVPPSMKRREHLLAINYNLGDAPIVWPGTSTLAPTVGAGLWVRREVFLGAVPWQNPDRLLSDRIGTNFMSSGDIEIGYLIGKAGYKRVYCPSLKLRHLIPSFRLTNQYFFRLITGIIRSEWTLVDKYKVKSYNLLRRALYSARFVMILLICPLLLLRRDGFRELLFVIVSSWANIMGPYKKYKV